MLLYCAYRANAIRKRSKLNTWGISTVGSALHSHCRGQRFESAMLHHKKSESYGFQTFCLPIFHRCCLEEPKLQFCFRVLIREAVRPAGAGSRDALRSRPSASSGSRCTAGSYCPSGRLVHAVFQQGVPVCHAVSPGFYTGSGSCTGRWRKRAGRRIPWSCGFEHHKANPKQFTERFSCAFAHGSQESFGRLTIRRRGVSRRFFLGRN